VKITILQGAFLPVPAKRGGAIEKAWQLLGEEFARMGHEVVHISRHCDGLPKEEKINGVLHVRVTGADASNNPYILKLKELAYVLRARKVLPKSDILVTHAFWAPIIIPRKRFGKIYVHVGRFPKGQLRLYSKAARFQTPSRVVTAAAQAELTEKDERVRTLPYPLPFSFPDDLNSYQKHSKKVLYAGRIHPEKGILHLLKAWEKIPNKLKSEWNLRIIGPWEESQGGGGESFFREVKKRAGESVEIDGPIFLESDLIKQYKEAELFVYPSFAKKGETFGLAILEAMSFGCVPIVSSLPCFMDFIKPLENGFCFDENSGQCDEELAMCLLDLMSKSSLSIYADRAVKTAKNFSVEKIAKLYIEDFASLLEEE
jgi:glycosyltransferase involved in cell wall biosynthesis